MKMVTSKPSRALGKSKFSMYLRTKCDRELYLSLFKAGEFERYGLPVPLKSRPGVAIVTTSGRDFEADQYDQLIQAIPDNVIHKNRGKTEVDPIESLGKAKESFFILQPLIEPERFRDYVLDNFGLTAQEKTYIPSLSGLKPDALFVHKKIESEFEVLADGSRKALDPKDNRLGISIIDLKNVVEGNPSYAGEVCLYAIFFANWLQTEGAAFKDRFFVSDQVYLWKHTEMPEFKRVMGLKEGGDIQNRISALLVDLQDGLIDYLIYMPSVRKFFKEDVPRVVQRGDDHGWHSVDYHVNPRCGSCDWLGNTDWLNKEELAIYSKNPTNYCMAAAESADHLSKIANLSRGAAQILVKGGHDQVAKLVDMPHSAPVLRKHAILKREKSHLGHRATAITKGIHSVDTESKVAGLSKYFDAEYDIIVNFDSGSGFLTGIGMRGIIFSPYEKSFTQTDGSTKKFRSFGEEAFVIAKDTMNAEWAALQSFIQKLAEWVDASDHLFSQNAFGRVHTQICFWEERQYQELCNAFGRHLLKVLTLPEKSQRALAWLFPSEDLIEKEKELAPGIVFINDIVDLSLRLPVKFAHTILGVSEAFHLDTMDPRRIDKYYREPLGNSIPRERIFEIWKTTTGTVRIGRDEVSIIDAIRKYESVLKAHAWALASITARLRFELKNSLEGTAPALNLSELSGMNKVAYDSKLWVQWDQINTATKDTEDKAKLITSVDRLEASYEAIVLTKFLKDNGNYEFEFEVSEDSTEAKLEENNKYYVLGIVGIPGFPLKTLSKLGVSAGTPDDFMPTHQIIAVYLKKFDRVNRLATIQLIPRWNGVRQPFDRLLQSGTVPIFTGPIYILGSSSPDFSDETKIILREVGNPKCATPAPEALAAMGKAAQRSLPVGTDPITPIAQILWQADKLSVNAIRSDADATGIANFAEKANSRPLNPSQKDAVFACAKNQLSLIWGPPGTGKTNTLTALLHSFVNDAAKKKGGRKMLITGPNYRAVEEIAGRLLENLDRDASSPANIFWVYSSSRDPKTIKSTNSHLKAASIRLSDSGASELRKSIADPNAITIVTSTIHNISKIAKFLVGPSAGSLQEIFDIVVIDESSQVEVARAVQAFAVIKSQGQLIVAGDHLQMPPINSLEAPKGAEHLVGSIQTYFIDRFNVQPHPLLTNYRSDQELVDYAKSIGYPPRLEANDPSKKLREIASVDSAISALPKDYPQTPAYKELLHPGRSVTTFIHDDIVSSQANEVEAKIVAGLAYCLRHSMSKELDTGNTAQKYTPYADEEFFSFGLGVVTPHKAQKALVIKELQKMFSTVDPDLIYDAVDTVERFQGGERQTILVSFGVGDVDIIEGEETFLLQLERTNVAVSRAQAKCILLMPKNLAYHLPSDEDAAKTSRAIKSYVEEFCNQKFVGEMEFDGEKRLIEVRWHQARTT